MSDSKHTQRGLDPEVTQKLQEQTSRLVESVNGGDFAQAMTIINELSEVRDQSLYQEVGRFKIARTRPASAGLFYARNI